MPSDKHHSGNHHWRAFAMLGVVMLFWAGNSIVGRAVRDEIPPFTLAFVRWTCASLVLLPFAARSVWRDRAAILASWKMVVVLGVLGVGTFNTLVYAGLRFTTATNALLVQASIPPMVIALDFLIFRVRAKGLQALGVALSIVGIAAVVFKGDPSAALRRGPRVPRRSRLPGRPFPHRGSGRRTRHRRRPAPSAPAHGARDGRRRSG